MAQASMRHGDPTMIDYTPSSGNVSAGQVVLLGNTSGIGLGIAHQDITNNTLGALDIDGGVYDVTMIGNYANYTKVWWDATNTKVTTTSTNNALFGYIVENGGGGANTTCTALLYTKQ